MEKLGVYGDDYPTPDGTCRRDYIHVVDLAKGHVAALQYALANPGCEAINLGTGVPYSVYEIIRAFQAVTGADFPCAAAARAASCLLVSARFRASIKRLIAAA